MCRISDSINNSLCKSWKCTFEHYNNVKLLEYKIIYIFEFQVC